MPLLGVRFLEEGRGSYSSYSKEYIFATDLELHEGYIYSKDWERTFHIKTQDGNTYNNAEVFITSIYQDIEEVIKQNYDCPTALKKITEISCANLPKVIEGYETPKTTEERIFGNYQIVGRTKWSAGTIVWDEKPKQKTVSQRNYPIYISVRFVQGSQYNETLSNKIYIYELEPHISIYYDDIYINSGHRFYIVNDNNYNYRNSEVIILAVSDKLGELENKLGVKLELRPDGSGALLVKLKSLIKSDEDDELQWSIGECYNNTPWKPECTRDTILGNLTVGSFSDVIFQSPVKHGTIKLSTPNILSIDTKNTSSISSSLTDNVNKLTDNFNKLKDQVDTLTYTLNYKDFDLKNIPTIDPVPSDLFEWTTPIELNSSDELTIDLHLSDEENNELINKLKNINKKGEKEMNFKNYFKFGPEYARTVRMSTYGPAFRDGGANDAYITYDAATGTWVNVENFAFDVDGAFYAMPVALKDLAEGDYILHNGCWVRIYVLDVENNYVNVENPWTKSRYEILPERSIFGFNFYTKLVSLFDLGGTTASADQPFGNPFMLMMLMNDNKSFNGNKMKDMLPFMFMANGGNFGEGMGDLFKNPLALMMMFNNG